MRATIRPGRARIVVARRSRRDLMYLCCTVFGPHRLKGFRVWAEEVGLQVLCRSRAANGDACRPKIGPPGRSPLDWAHGKTLMRLV